MPSKLTFRVLGSLCVGWPFNFTSAIPFSFSYSKSLKYRIFLMYSSILTAANRLAFPSPTLPLQHFLSLPSGPFRGWRHESMVPRPHLHGCITPRFLWVHEIYGLQWSTNQRLARSRPLAFFQRTVPRQNENKFLIEISTQTPLEFLTTDSLNVVSRCTKNFLCSCSRVLI